MRYGPGRCVGVCLAQRVVDLEPSSVTYDGRERPLEEVVEWNEQVVFVLHATKRVSDLPLVMATADLLERWRSEQLCGPAGIGGTALAGAHPMPRRPLHGRFMAGLNGLHDVRTQEAYAQQYMDWAERAAVAERARVAEPSHWWLTALGRSPQPPAAPRLDATTHGILGREVSRLASMPRDTSLQHAYHAPPPPARPAWRPPGY